MSNISWKGVFKFDSACTVCGQSLKGCPAGEWITFRAGNTVGPKNFFAHRKCIGGGANATAASLPTSTSLPTPTQPPPQIQAPVEPIEPLTRTEREYIEWGETINAIKAIRVRTNYCGLKEAKDAVDRYRGELLNAQPKTPAQPAIPTAPIAPPPHILDAVNTSDLHYQASEILALMAMGQYPFLYGSPGAGKTTLMSMIAERANLPFLLIPCSGDMLRSEILGTKNPLQNGQYTPAKFHDVWTNGGVVLFDETGLARGEFLNLLNAALAQKEIHFPDGIAIKKHRHCFIVFADNSNLWGTDPKFPERQDAGSAFRNRLAYVKFHYDEALELRILTSINPVLAGNWHKQVLKIREVIKTNDIPVSASPRFAFAALPYLVRFGYSRKNILRCCELSLFEGLSEDVIGVAITAIERSITIS